MASSRELQGRPDALGLSELLKIGLVVARGIRRGWLGSAGGMGRKDRADGPPLWRNSALGPAYTIQRCLPGKSRSAAIVPAVFSDGVRVEPFPDRPPVRRSAVTTVVRVHPGPSLQSFRFWAGNPCRERTVLRGPPLPRGRYGGIEQRMTGSGVAGKEATTANRLTNS